MRQVLGMGVSDVCLPCFESIGWCQALSCQDQPPLGFCSVHEAEAKVRGSMDEECDNICRLTCFVVSRVLTDWQAALLYVRAYPYAAHVMVSYLSRGYSQSSCPASME